MSFRAKHPKLVLAIGYTISLLIILILWQLTSVAVGSPAFPTPVHTFEAFFTHLKSIAPHFVISAWRVVVSMVLATAIALPVALLLSRNNYTDGVFGPFLFVTYPIPKIVFLPVLLVFFGLGSAPKIMLITLTVFFQILMSVRDATRSVSESAIDSLRSLGANSWQVYRHGIIPAIMPAFFTSLRISSGTAIAVLFIAESIAGTSGLGWLIVDAWGLVNYPKMFAGIVATGILGVVVYEVIAVIDRKVTRWTNAGNSTDKR